MIDVDWIQNFAIIITFSLVVFAAVEVTRVMPRKPGVRLERWRVILLLLVLSATVMIVTTARTWG
jgi:archaellum biogenesis protein FlaJ (TadC family)